MSLFGASRPKGITKEELRFVKAELGSAPFGHGSEALSRRQVDDIAERLELCLDPDTQAERTHNWGQVDQNEVTKIEEQAAHDKDLHLTTTQQDHVKRVLQKYIDIDKHGGLFSL